MRRSAFVLTLGILLVAASVPNRPLHADAVQYTVTDLGTIDGLVPTTTGINKSGQVSGYVAEADGTTRAVRYTKSSGWSYVRGLESISSRANAINDAGDLAGSYVIGGVTHAFRYSDAGGFTEIPMLTGAISSFGMGINTSGEVVGYSGTASGGQFGWRADPGATPVKLPTLGGTVTMACGVNDHGQIVASGTLAAGSQHAFRINADNSTIDASSFDGASGFSTGCAIDSDGTIGGFAQGGGALRAFTFDSALHDVDSALGSAFGQVFAASNGSFVGMFLSSADFSSRGFVYTSANGAFDLNALIDPSTGWMLVDGNAINSVGQIVGDGTFQGNTRSYLLTPIAAKDTTPPEITNISATPSTITPPNNTSVPVTVSVTATDNVDPSPVCSIDSITAAGSTAASSSVTGALTGSVTAAGGTTYTFNVTCADASGNQAHSSVDVVVPPDTTPPVISSVFAKPSSISPVNGANVSVSISVSATDDSGAAPACSLASITGPGTAGVDYAVTGQYMGTVKAIGGRTYVFTAHCVDASGNGSQASTNVVVPADTTAPVISSVVATPSTIWPPLGQMVPVTIAVSATDDSGVVSCSLAGITGPGTAGADYQVTGTLSGTVKAIGGRTYSFNALCTDYSGNASPASANVVVPPDTTAPVIAGVSAAPSTIWPPDNKMHDIAVSVSASDDVDPAPVCTLTSVSGASSDAALTGALTASVRASNGNVYTLTVTCRDFSGNSSTASTVVTITKGPATILKPNGQVK